MTLRVSGKNLDIGEALRQHVLEKVEATVSRYFSGSVGGHVVMTREGSGYRSDCTLRLSSGMSLHAEGRAQEPYRCFDQAAEKIESRLRRYKTRLKGHAAAAAANARGKVANYLIEQPGEEEEEPAEGFDPVVVAEGTEDLKSLSVASAVAELDLTGAPVIVFQHAGSGRVNVVYRRRDGAIGWLDPRAGRPSSRAV
ncbi:MAG: ribosome-associated translation inhibitor RaiA [Hyphomicrobiales bacterium]|jgi:ribosomal subunit interface protein|nr:ribosome-associated translation inhibitor RaiA [Hyphomicrobiales bacterium]MBV9906770.1 ribosome-associated translation inhibitor RaiA [Hyphomicrobiales bacterium]